MKASIAGVMNMNMFGIPMVGPNTCGSFQPNTTDNFEEICGRWVQLATFYPLARKQNHLNDQSPPNEPWNLQEPYRSWAKNALIDRLQYVRHIYTCLFEATESGQTCYDPIFFHYPELDDAFLNIENTFLVGEAIKVSPVLMADATVVTSFFPNGDWVDLNKWSNIVKVNDPSGGKHIILPLDNGKDTALVAKHLRPGKLIVFQYNFVRLPAMTTVDIQLKSITLLVSRDPNGYAEGKVYLDRGEERSELSMKEYEYYNFRLSGKVLRKEILNTSNLGF